MAIDIENILSMRDVAEQPARLALPATSEQAKAMREWVDALSELTAVVRQVVVRENEISKGVTTNEGANTEHKIVEIEKKDDTKQELAVLEGKYAQQGKELTEVLAQAGNLTKEINKVRLEFKETKNKHQDDLTDEKNKTTRAENHVTDLKRKLDDANDKEQKAQQNLEKSNDENIRIKGSLASAKDAASAANWANQKLRRQVKDLQSALDKTKPATDSPVVTPTPPPPVTIAVKVDQVKVRKDLDKVDMMVSQIKEPAWRRYAGAKLVGTVVSAAGVIAGGVGSLAMGLDPSLGVAACLAAPVIKFTIDKICSGWRTGSYQATLNKAIIKASVANSWVEQLANTKALINIVNKFASPNSKERPNVLEKLAAEAEKLKAKITEQKSFEHRIEKEKFPVYQVEIQSLKGAGGGWPLVMDLTFYAGTIGSIGLFSGEMVSFGNQITSWVDQVYRFFV